MAHRLSYLDIQVSSGIEVTCGKIQSLNGHFKKKVLGTSLVVQWLRLSTPNAGGLGLIPGQGTRSHMLQLRASTTKKKKKKIFLK